MVCAKEIPHPKVLCYSTVLVLEDKELHQLLVGDGYTDLVGTVDEGLDHIPWSREGNLWLRLWLIVSNGGCWHFGENACLRLKVLGLTLAIAQDSARCFLVYTVYDPRCAIVRATCVIYSLSSLRVNEVLRRFLPVL